MDNIGYKHSTSAVKLALRRKKKLHYLGGLLALALFSTQFYLFSSGSLQLSHIMLLLFVALCAILYKTDRGMVKGTMFVLFTSFMLYSSCVNIWYYFFRVGHDTALLRASLYLWFDYIIFLSILQYSRFLTFSLFRKVYVYPFLASLLFLVAVYCLGLGRYDYAPRYNAFFNDPNQMAFWVLCALAVIVITEPNKWVKRAALIFAVWACLVSMSRAGFLGMLVLLSGYFYPNIKKLFVRKNLWKLILFVAGLVVAGGVSVKIYLGSQLANRLNIWERLMDTNMLGELVSRGYGLLLQNPEYLLVGYGGGELLALNHELEIHSTWGGILFYYGVIGLGLFVGFVYKILRPLPMPALLVALGPMVYSFFTYGARTPIFFIFLAVLFSYNRYIKPEQHDKLSNIQCSNSPVQ